MSKNKSDNFFCNKTIIYNFLYITFCGTVSSAACWIECTLSHGSKLKTQEVIFNVIYIIQSAEYGWGDTPLCDVGDAYWDL
jgi:hypothetical protein